MKKSLALLLCILLFLQTGCAQGSSKGGETSDRPSAGTREEPATIPNALGDPVPVTDAAAPHETVIESSGYSICTSSKYASAEESLFSFFTFPLLWHPETDSFLLWQKETNSLNDPFFPMLHTRDRTHALQFAFCPYEPMDIVHYK